VEEPGELHRGQYVQQGFEEEEVKDEMLRTDSKMAKEEEEKDEV
jgi:hypothetical protein